MEKDKKRLGCEISLDEEKNLLDYCLKYGVTKTEVIREFLRNIELYRALRENSDKLFIESLVSNENITTR